MNPSQPISQPISLRGACLCGRVRFEVQAQLKQFYFCHCQQCRKLTGSAHASNILAEPTAIHWVQGERWVKRYDDENGREFTHVFCDKCGSGLPFLNVKGTTLFIPTGTLDHEPPIAVSRNIFWGEAPKWYEEGLKAKRCSGFPEES